MAKLKPTASDGKLCRCKAAGLMAPGVLHTYLPLRPHSGKCVSVSGGAWLTPSQVILLFCFLFFFFLPEHCIPLTDRLTVWKKCKKKKIIKILSAFQSRSGLVVCDLWKRGRERARGFARVWRDRQTVMYVYQEWRAADAQKSLLQSLLKLGPQAKCRQSCGDARDCSVCARGHSLIMCVLLPALVAVLVSTGRGLIFKGRWGARNSLPLLSGPGNDTANSGYGKVFPRKRSAVCKNTRQLF